jgi:hypothetical protein
MPRPDLQRPCGPTPSPCVVSLTTRTSTERSTPESLTRDSQPSGLKTSSCHENRQARATPLTPRTRAERSAAESATGHAVNGFLDAPDPALRGFHMVAVHPGAHALAAFAPWRRKGAIRLEDACQFATPLATSAWCIGISRNNWNESGTNRGRIGDSRAHAPAFGLTATPSYQIR